MVCAVRHVVVVLPVLMVVVRGEYRRAAADGLKEAAGRRGEEGRNVKAAVTGEKNSPQAARNRCGRIFVAAAAVSCMNGCRWECVYV